jgi:acetyl-CoA carboxylase biotin carboxyl carrier protein
MDPSDLKKLMDWAARAPILEIEVVEGDIRVHLVKGAPAAVPPGHAEPATHEAAEHVLVAPLPGLFYLKASPEAAPYAAAGQQIVAGDTVGLIEAMKMFNPVVSDVSGVIVAILVEAGQEVAAGQPLVRIRRDEWAST